MKRGRLPLTALRSFEAAGRHESFTQASEELFVSQAAISRQVRELEEILGKTLFARSHRQVKLTSEGKQLLETLSRSFSAIEASMAKVAGEHGEQVLTVSVEPSFAFCWLVPELKNFRSLHPGIDVSVESDNHIIDFTTHHAEVAIRFSPHHSSWMGTQSKHLHDSEMIPVISPELMSAKDPLNEPTDLFDFTLLHEWNRDDWRQWFAISGVVSEETERGPIYDDGVFTLQAALDGQGVAIVEKRFTAHHVIAGRLIQPFDISIRQGAYWLVVRDFSTLSEPASRFADWVQSSLAKSA